MNKVFGLIGVGVIAIVGYTLFLQDSEEEAVVRESVVQEEAPARETMSFFVTSKNPGNGANFGGLAGADAHCQALASEAGAGDGEWRAYLSAVGSTEIDATNARDRIGNGPWYNAKGVLIAENVEGLHTSPNITKTTALDETGNMINGRGDTPNVHDILTGSFPNGTVATGEGDTTCNDWTSEGEGSAIVGHHDRMGLNESDEAKSWNSSHGSRGCSLPNLNGTGGGGLLYCFAVSE